MQMLLGRLRGLSPFGPIFGKELRTTARRKRTYVLRFLYLGALFLLLLFFWSVSRPNFYYYGAEASVAARAARNAELGSQFFAVFSFFTLAAMGLVGPILTATAVNSERLHKTLPVLLMTPITAWQIVSGKLFSRLLVALTLIGLSLPVLAVVRLLGGVEIEQMVGSICLCLSLAIMSAAVGLMLSTLMNRAYSVILLSYAFLFFLYFVIPLMLGLLAAAGSFPGNQVERLLINLGSLGHPWVAMMLVAVPDARVPFKTFSWHWCAGSHVAFAALLLLLCSLILRRMARKEAEGGGGGATGGTAIAPPPLPAMAMPAAAVKAAAAVPPLPSPGVGTAPSPRTISENPVLWREIRRPLMNRRWQAIVAAAVVVLTMLIIYSGLANIDDHRRTGGVLMENEVHIGFAIIFCALLNLLVCIVSATAIAQEKESDTWTLLLATPLTSWQIVAGKLAGLLRRMAWPVALIAAHFVLFTLLGVLSFDTFVIVMWLMLTTNITWLATGLYLSLRLKTVTFAVILNLLLPLLAYGGVAMVLGILGVVLANDDDWAEASMLYAPYAYMGEAIDDLSEEDRWSYRRQQMWVPAIGEVSVPDFYSFVFTTGMGHLILTALTILWTTRRFDAIVGRAQQTPGALPPPMAHPHGSL